MTETSLSGDLQAADTLPRLIRAAAAAYGDATAITLTDDDGVETALTFTELDERSAELARGLIAHGAGKGTRIGFLFGNGPGFALILAAITRIGAIAIPISTLIKANELVRVLRQSDVAGLIVQRRLLGHDYVNRLCEALPALRSTGPDLRLVEAPYLRWIVSEGAALPPGILDRAILAGEAAGVPDALLRAIEAEVHPTDQIVEIYTSGSMALPKGVRHLHGPAMARARYLAAMTGIERGRRRSVPLPMFWVGGLMLFLLADWVAGAVTACTEGTPTDSRMARGSVMTREDIQSRAAQRPFWSLGMSETLGPYSHGDALRVEGYPLCPPLDHAADGFEIRLVDEGGSPVGEGGRGEIQVRGHALTPGLHKLERDAYFTPDGFYRTGDIGVLDGGRIHFTGRSGDMIKTAKANVSPPEVELELQALAGVHSAYVVGLPDAERGQLVAAAIVPRDGEPLDFAAIEATLRTRLSSYKVPRAWVAITRDEVPMLASNKVARRALEMIVAAKLGRAV